MQEVMLWSKGIQEYIAGFNGRRMKQPKRCAKCGCTKLHKWGTYERNVIEEQAEHRVPIQRFRCIKCKRTSSLLPDFCLSRIQYAAAFVMRLLSWALGGLGGGAAAPKPSPPNAHESLRRRGYTLRQRFVRQENLWLTFLRERGYGGFSQDAKGTIKVLFAELFRLWDVGELLCGFYAATGRHFMAK